MFKIQTPVGTQFIVGATLLGLCCLVPSSSALAQESKQQEDTRPAYNSIFLKARAKRATDGKNTSPRADQVKVTNQGATKADIVKVPSTAVPKEKPEQPLQTKPETKEPTKGAIASEKLPAKDREASEKTSDYSAFSSLLGVTLWLFREPGTKDENRVLGAKGKLVAERTSIDKAIGKEQKVRLTIEVPSDEDVYVYIIDREKNSDGSFSVPYLIFPLTTTRNGDNRLSGGKILCIPSPEDEVPFFSALNDRPELIGELLTVIVTREKLPLTVSNEILELDPNLVKKWEEEYGGKPSRLDEKNDIGKLWTEAERKAIEEKQPLTAQDSLPLTVFRVESKTPSGFAVSFLLNYKQPPIGK